MSDLLVELKEKYHEPTMPYDIRRLIAEVELLRNAHIASRIELMVQVEELTKRLAESS